MNADKKYTCGNCEYFRYLWGVAGLFPLEGPVGWGVCVSPERTTIPLFSSTVDYVNENQEMYCNGDGDDSMIYCWRPISKELKKARKIHKFDPKTAYSQLREENAE